MSAWAKHYLIATVATMTVFFCTSVMIWGGVDTYPGAPNKVDRIDGWFIACLLTFGAGIAWLVFLFALVTADFDVGINIRKTRDWATPGTTMFLVGAMALLWRNPHVYDHMRVASGYALVFEVLMALAYITFFHFRPRAWLKASQRKREDKGNLLQAQTNLDRCIILRKRVESVLADRLLARPHSMALEPFVRQAQITSQTMARLQTIMDEGLANDHFRMTEALQRMEVAADNVERYVRLLKMDEQEDNRDIIADKILPAINNSVKSEIRTLLEQDSIQVEVTWEMLQRQLPTAV